MEQLQLGRWDKTALPIASHFSPRSRFVDLLGESLISGRWWKCHDAFSLQTMTFSCNLAGLFAKIWVQTFWGWIADSRKGYARLSPVSSLPLGKLVRSCRRSYRYVSMIIYSSVLLSNCFLTDMSFPFIFQGQDHKHQKHIWRNSKFKWTTFPCKIWFYSLCGRLRRRLQNPWQRKPVPLRLSELRYPSEFLMKMSWVHL